MPMLDRQGTKLFYTEAGAGGPPLLFVHGWCGDHSHFAPQLEYFARRHRVVAVDRRGHGQSDKPVDDYTIAGFADDLAWTCRELGLHKPVVVVHSMGVIGLELAARHPDVPGALVVLDAPAVPPAPLRQAFEQALVGLRTPAWRDVVRGFADNVAFRPGSDAALKARLIDGMCALPQQVVVASWASFLAHDPAPAVRACRVPLLFVHSSMPSDLDAVRALVPQVVIGQTVGAGHFCQLEAPEQVNGMIERFLADQQVRAAA